MKAAAFALAALLAGAAPPPQPQATRVLVDKSERKLYVFAGEKLLAAYPIGLGYHPIGPKQQQGDQRTPEGHYVLDYKNPNSSYYRSIHISYPNNADRAAARQRHVSPGGDVMIHGLPNDPYIAHRVRVYGSPDWTDGCIALSDENMKALWDQVSVPIPIEIVP